METLDLTTAILKIGSTGLSALDLIIIGFSIALLASLTLLFIIWRSSKSKAALDAMARQLSEQRAQASDASLAKLMATQNELAGRLSNMQSNVASQQSNMARQLDERLANVTHRVSQSITETTKSTQENLAKLQERLAVIDTAQNNIQNLAQDVVGLQAILQNKQTRGAFGQSRMAEGWRSFSPRRFWR